MSWSKSDIGFQRVYPWVLLGPYVALLVSYFPLERGRLRLSLPLNIAGCAAFVAASHAINARTMVSGTNVVIIKSQHNVGPTAGSHQPITSQIEVSKIGRGELEEQKSAPTREPVLGALLGKVTHGQSDFSDAGLTNLLAQLPPGLRPPPSPPGLRRSSVWSELLDLLAYGAVAGLAHSVHFYRRFRERERRALFLESNLSNARLNALRAQLQPHFLFNSLNAIVALLRRDPLLAESTLMSLSELLRLTLSQSERQEIALREEMHFVRRYLEIQQIRFCDKLRVEQDIEPAAMDCLVPTLLLQPLVENAIRHGIEPAENAGLVRLTARQQDGLLILTVEDDGVGLPDAAAVQPRSKQTARIAGSELPSAATSAGPSPSDWARGGTGIGLSNLRARLETLYGSRQKLELISRSEGGVTVLVQIPWRAVKLIETAAGATHS
jgi:signal transduction histidine kinase